MRRSKQKKPTPTVNHCQVCKHPILAGQDKRGDHRHYTCRPTCPECGQPEGICRTNCRAHAPTNPTQQPERFAPR